MKEHSVALILQYYGKLPNYFPLWLKSAGTNKNFTFMIFSDCDFSDYNVPENVKTFHMTFDELKARIAPHLDFDFVLNRPYKICDYRPMCGLIFQDYLKYYDFWGHIDPDIIWGDFNKFVTPEILNTYDKIYRLGHLVIYRNTDKIRTFILHELPGWAYSYRNIYKTPMTMSLNESVVNEHLFTKYVGGGGAI